MPCGSGEREGSAAPKRHCDIPELFRVVGFAGSQSYRVKMTIRFMLLVNKQGQTRLAKYTDQKLTVEERRVMEGEIVRKCLARSDKQVRPREQR